MFTFFSYGLGCILGGAVSAILICGILLFLSARQSKYGTLSPIALLAAIILFCVLFYQLANLFCAIQCKSVVLDAIDGLRQRLQNIDLQTSKEIISNLIDRYPIINVFFDTSLLNDINWSDPITSLHELIKGKFNSFIWTKIGWASGFTVVLGAAMFIPVKNGIGRRRNGHHDPSSQSDCYYGEDFY